MGRSVGSSCVERSQTSRFCGSHLRAWFVEYSRTCTADRPGIAEEYRRRTSRGHEKAPAIEGIQIPLRPSGSRLSEYLPPTADSRSYTCHAFQGLGEPRVPVRHSNP